jgi:predicted nucleic acid-binding protein
MAASRHSRVQVPRDPDLERAIKRGRAMLGASTPTSRVVHELALRGAAGADRVRVPDALVAAAAAERGFAVLHYDKHFDALATVLAFSSQWVAPPGSIA